MRRLADELRQNPFAYAFLQGDGEDDADGSEPYESAGEESSCVSRVSSMDTDVQNLLDDMDTLQAFQVDALALDDALSDGVSDCDGRSDCSTTSHEFGVVQTEETTSESEVEDLSAGANQALWSRIGATATLTKGKKRRLQRNLNELSGVYVVPPPKPVIPRAPRRVVRPPVKPYSVLEIFTWTLAITLVATTQGWIGREPVTLPRWDLRQASDRSDALQYVARVQPDLLVVAWPCTVWSPLQYYSHEMTAERLDVLRRRQQADREDFLSFVHEAIKLQRLQGRACLGENRSRSHAWHEPYIQTAFDGEAYGITHMCAFGLKHPQSHLPLKKPTRLAGTPEVVECCSRRCPGCPQHALTLGSYWSHRAGKTMSVAEFAGGYTRSFAKAVIKGAEQFLDHWDEQCVSVFAEVGVPEERFKTPDEEVPVIEIDGQEQAIEVDGDAQVDADAASQLPEFHELTGGRQSVRKTVAALHRRLGHPSSEVLGRMLRLAGASQEVLDYAEGYKCPVCQGMEVPGRPMQSRARGRPAGFNVEVHVDLKYASNIKDKTFVALSAICAGANKHMAVLLKTRKPAYVAQKFIKHWIRARVADDA